MLWNVIIQEDTCADQMELTLIRRWSLYNTGLDKQKFSAYPSVLTYVFGAQKNRLIEMVLLSTHNICFGWGIRKLNFRYALLTKVLYIYKTGIVQKNVNKSGQNFCIWFLSKQLERNILEKQNIL